MPVIEKQVERIDKSVQKVLLDVGPNPPESTWGVPMLADPQTTVETASKDIRDFALRQLEENGDVDNAHRLASLWEMEYVYDEEALQRARAARRAKYLQWDQVFCDGQAVPYLLSTPEAIRTAYAEMMRHPNDHGNVFGFDVEWGDDGPGAALLQIASSNFVMLIDIPALSQTAEGVKAMKETIGRLFAASDDDKSAVVVGFCCRQDLVRLKASPCVTVAGDKTQQQQHWLTNVSAVIDLQAVIDQMDRENGIPCVKRGLGLSRCCERFLGKPLDKSEQCSLWTRRPLVQQQREYAALDAWACVAMFRKICPHQPKAPNALAAWTDTEEATEEGNKALHA